MAGLSPERLSRARGRDTLYELKRTVSQVLDQKVRCCMEPTEVELSLTDESPHVCVEDSNGTKRHFPLVRVTLTSHVCVEDSP